MLFRTLSAAVYGINADLVDIEVDLNSGPRRGGISPVRHHRWLTRRCCARIA